MGRRIGPAGGRSSLLQSAEQMGVCESSLMDDDLAREELAEGEMVQARFLAAARQKKYEECLKILRDEAAHVDINRGDVNDDRKNALHIACENGDTRLIKGLVAHQANVNALTKVYGHDS